VPFGEGDQQPLVPEQVIQHPAQERRIGGAAAQLGRPDPAQRQEPAEPLGILGQEGERAQGKRLGGIPLGFGGRRLHAALPAGTMRWLTILSTR
jgi:hypothetical protein